MQNVVILDGRLEQKNMYQVKTIEIRGFPGGPVGETSCFHCQGHEFDPWSGNYDSHMPFGMAQNNYGNLNQVWSLVK